MSDPAAFDRILVPLDGSERAEQALPYALTLATEGGAVVLLQVVPDAETLRKPLGQVLMTADEVREMLTSLARKDLERGAERYPAGDRVRYELLTPFGDTAGTLLETAEQQNADLIVMASTGRGALSRLALGSVADRVARNATTPVLLIRESDESPTAGAPHIRRIVVPLDESERAQRALPFALTLAQRLGVELALVTVLEPQVYTMTSPTFGLPVSADLYGEMETQIRSAAEERLATASRDLTSAGATVSTHLLQGSAAGALLDFTNEDDVIVMTSRGASGIARWLLGSVAEKLVRQAAAPVLLVPSGN